MLQPTNQTYREETQKPIRLAQFLILNKFLILNYYSIQFSMICMKDYGNVGQKSSNWGLISLDNFVLKKERKRSYIHGKSRAGQKGLERQARLGPACCLTGRHSPARQAR